MHVLHIQANCIHIKKHALVSKRLRYDRILLKLSNFFEYFMVVTKKAEFYFWNPLEFNVPKKTENPISFPKTF